MRNVSDAMKASVNAQETSVAYIHLITLNSDEMPAPIRACDDSFEILPVAGGRGVVSRGDEFIFAPFQISLPNQDDTGIGRARITIDNVSQQVIAAIRSSRSPISLKIEIVLSTDVDAPEITLDNFVLDSVNYDALTISGEVSVQYLDREPFPFARMTPSNAPGLF